MQSAIQRFIVNMIVRTPGLDRGKENKVMTHLFRGGELDMTVRIP